MSMSLQQSRCRAAAPSRRATTVVPRALFRVKAPEKVEKPTTVEPKVEKKKAAVSMTPSVINALDFAAPRSKRDAELLYDAKYGARGSDGKMTPEQYQALRRKVIGTAKDYWKDWVEEEQVKNIKTYYKPEEAGGTVPYLNVLVGIVVAMLGATVLVVAKTSGV